MKRLTGLTVARHLLAAAAAIGSAAVIGSSSGCAADPDAGNDKIVVELDDVLDDLEDGDDMILALGFRVGFWYGFNDATVGAVQTPEPNFFLPEPGGSAKTPAYSARSRGNGFTNWGAGIGLDLNNTGDPMGGPTNRGTYDASAFKGITFRAKGNVPVRVSVATEAVVDIAYKGTCVPDPTGIRTCDDTHGRLVSTGPEWRTYVIPFDTLRQEGFGQPALLDMKKAMAVHFSVSQNLNFDFQIDDIGLYK